MKSILITGCNRGLGLGLVRNLVKRGPKGPEMLLATCRDIQKAQELQEIASENNQVHILQFDVNNFDDYQRFSEEVAGIVKDNGLNVLFNNAGVSPKYTRLNYVKYDQLMDTFKTNTVAPILLSKTLLPLLKKASTNNESLPLGVSRSAIINMSSILGSISLNKDGGLYPYKCSKAALNQATASMALDLSNDGILALALHPGWVKTSMGGPKAPMEVESSTGSIINFLYEINEKHNGGFYQWDGKPVAY